MRIKPITAGTIACVTAAAVAASVIPSGGSHAAPAKPVAARWSATPQIGEAAWTPVHSLAEATKDRVIVEARAIAQTPGRPLCPSKVDTPSSSRCVPTTYVTYQTTKTVKGDAPATFKAFFVGTVGGLAVDGDPFPDKGDVNLMFLSRHCPATGVWCFGGPQGRFDVHGGVVHAHVKGGPAAKLDGKGIDEAEAMVR